MNIIYMLIAAVIIYIAFKVLRKGMKMMFWVCAIGGGLFVLSALEVIPWFRW